jgi:hypothetical protein
MTSGKKKNKRKVKGCPKKKTFLVALAKGASDEDGFKEEAEEESLRVNETYVNQYS